MITNFKIFEEYKSPLNYKLDNENAQYFVRYSNHIEEDLKRGWSSWGFGGDGFNGSIDDLIESIKYYKNETGGEFFISGFNIWVDENTKIERSDDVVYLYDYELRELYTNYWVVVDRINARDGLSAHELPDNLIDISDILSLINDNRYIYDGTGDGESFDPKYAKVIYSGEINDKLFHIIEVGENEKNI